jgi:hypothetical protein
MPKNTNQGQERKEKEKLMSNNEDQQPQSGPRDYLDLLRGSVGTNRDTEGLGTIALGPSVIGRVDAINGEDGKEVPEFVATKHELKQLAGYLVEERIDHDFSWFADQSIGSSEWRWSVFIGRRLDRLTEVLGQEAMERVWDDAIVSFRKRHPKITDEDWRVFTNGSEEEQEAWRKKVFEEKGAEQH